MVDPGSINRTGRRENRKARRNRPVFRFAVRIKKEIVSGRGWRCKTTRFLTRLPTTALLDRRLETDGAHLFLHEGEEYLNLNRARQMGIPQILSAYLRRIDRLDDGQIIYFPFIGSEHIDEPRTIQMTPGVAFGRPVLAQTGIAAEVIAGRFRARDTIVDLAEEYGVSPAMIEDCVRWELPQVNAA